MFIFNDKLIVFFVEKATLSVVSNGYFKFYEYDVKSNEWDLVKEHGPKNGPVYSTGNFYYALPISDAHCFSNSTYNIKNLNMDPRFNK